jgi:hypothetical protein
VNSGAAVTAVLPGAHHTTPARAPGDAPNHARYTFLDDRSRDFWIDWERAADDAVAQLRTEAAVTPTTGR